MKELKLLSSKNYKPQGPNYGQRHYVKGQQ